MGCCSSILFPSNNMASLKAKSKNIDKDLQKDLNYDEQVKKLLLLGAGESGKSTLFKQMITLYGNGYSEEDRLMYKKIIFQNILNSIQTLIKYDGLLSKELECEIEPHNKVLIKTIENLSLDDDIPYEIAKNINDLWNDKGMQKLYENRAKFQFPDSGKYFLDKIFEICQQDYIPSQEDVLKSRVRTTGIVETSFDIDGNQFEMFDVGGQRNERKKWIHCFENVSCVIFVAAISEYDQTLFEDETTNRVREALNLFNEICNSKWFITTSMILFLNKRDLFMQKVQKILIKDYFNEYNGPEYDYDSGCEFFRELFESKNKSQREIYTHVTCATDSDNILHVFYSVKDIIVKQSLRDGGLL